MNYLQHAIEAHKSGNAQLAFENYQKQLKLTPDDPNALQLFGLLLMSGNQFLEATKLMERSLQINEQQPHVWNNLGSCYKRQNLVDKAVECYKKALEFKSDFIESIRNLTYLLIQENRAEEALKFTETMLFNALDNNDIKLLHAKAANAAGQHELAANLYESLLLLNPDDSALKHDLGIAYRLNGQPLKALEQFKSVLSVIQDSFALYHNLANTYSDMAELTQAIEYYQKALTLNPVYLDSHVNLNNLLWETGDNESFLKSFEKTLDAGQASADLVFSYAHFLLRAKDFQRGLDTLEKFKFLLEAEPEYYNLKGKYHFALEDYSEALDAMQLAVGHINTTVEHRTEFAKQLIENHEIDRAVAQLDKVLQTFPEDQIALAYMGHCRRALGEEWEKELNDYQGMVKEFDLVPLLEARAGEDFLGRLRGYLNKKHTTLVQPLNQTLQTGTQTRGDLFNDESSLIQTLKSVITDCIQDYMLNNPNRPRNYLGEREVNDFQFSGSWSVRLASKGFHSTHVHPQGWLSSVFYVEVPASIENEESKEGWLHFGQAKLDRTSPLEKERIVRPVAGKLVLFPSYMWHGTIPFNSDDERMTIAFDVSANP